MIEDLAPVEPGAKAARYWCLLLGLSFATFGGLGAYQLLDPRGMAASLVCALVAFVVAFAKLTYSQRALAMFGFGLAAATLDVSGLGPSGLLGSVGWEMHTLRLGASVALPGTLLFRSKYRAYAGARWFLAAGYALAAPYVIHLLMRLVRWEGSLSDATAVLSAVAMLAGLAGFMGSETTAAGTYSALAVIVAFALDCAGQKALSGTSPADILLGSALPSLVFAGCALTSSFGLFQYLASRCCAAARQIDVHQPPAEAPRVLRESGDWTTRA